MTSLTTTRPLTEPDGLEAPGDPGSTGRRRWSPGAGRPAWSVPARLAIFTAAAVLYTWDLSRVGMGNSFYAAAVKSGTESWKAFFFGSLDPGSFITVDKPPGSLWVMELSGRLFGFSSLSLLLPEAIAGVVVVMVVYRLVRKWAGEGAAALAALACAVTPVAVVMFRYDNPDAILTLSLVLAGWALWSALETGRTSRLVLCGALVGFAFTTKMLEAFIVLPAFGLVYLWSGRPAVGRRLTQLGWAAVALIVASGWWVAAVELWPSSSRPYVGGSTNNSELNLIFGYNGLSRIFGSGGGAGAPGGVSFAGSPGILRMFNQLLGGQISWLLPMALAGLVAGMWLTRSLPRTSLRRAGFLLWGGWVLVYLLVFSDAKGIFHPYYTVALAPAVAALAAGGAKAMWDLGRGRRWLAWLLPAAVLGSTLWAVALLGRTPGYDGGLSRAVLVLGALATATLLLVLVGLVRLRAVGIVAGGMATAGLLAGPAAYSLTTVGNPANGALASAGPSTTGSIGGPGGFGRLAGRHPGGFGGNESVPTTLVHYLEQHQGSARFLLVVSGSQSAAAYILATGKPVMAMGGFTGSDPAPTLAQFEHLVATGQVHEVLVQGVGGVAGGFGGNPGLPAAPPGRPTGAFGPPAGGGRAGGPFGGGSDVRRPGFGGGPGGGSSTSGAIDQWVKAHGTAVPASATGGGTSGGTLYVVTPASTRS